MKNCKFKIIDAVMVIHMPDGTPIPHQTKIKLEDYSTNGSLYTKGKMLATIKLNVDITDVNFESEDIKLEDGK